MREYYNGKECLRFNTEPHRVTADHPLLGQHVVLGAMHSLPLNILRSQIQRLHLMPSCNKDPDFWRTIKTGVVRPKMRIRGASINGYRGVRKLVVGDQIGFAEQYLLTIECI